MEHCKETDQGPRESALLLKFDKQTHQKLKGFKDLVPPMNASTNASFELSKRKKDNKLQLRSGAFLGTYFFLVGGGMGVGRD